MRDGRQSRDRSLDRRQESADGGPPPAERPAGRGRDARARGRRCCAHVRRGVDAEPALLGAGAARARVPRRLSLHQALHLALALGARLHRRHRGRRRLDRRARRLRSAGLRYLVRPHHVARRLRLDLRLPGRGRRPRPGLALGSRPLRRPRGAHRSAGEPRAHRARARRIGLAARAGADLLGRLARRRGALRVRALARQPARSFEARRRLLQHQRLHRADRAGRGGVRPAVVSASRLAPSSAETVRAMFTRIARRYDLMNSLMTAGFHHVWRRRVAATAAGAPAGPMLDLATGTADLAIAVRARTPGRFVAGADFSEGMLQVGQEKLRQRRVAHLQLLAADALALPFRDGAFACVMSAFLLRNLEDLARGLAEMRRVTARGGRVVTLDIVRPAQPLWGAVFGAYFSRVVPAIGAFVAGDRQAYTYLPQSVDRFVTPDELAELMEDVGLRDVSYRRLGLGTIALHIGIA